MPVIKDILAKYHNRIDYLDLELILAHTLGKPREFVLAHPEYKIPKFQISNLKLKIARRMRDEPLAYILGQKEFYGLDFKVNKAVLIPRPETELLVDLSLKEIEKNRLRATGYGLQDIIIDVGTGSGNIIISLEKELKKSKLPNPNYQLLASDISSKALAVAKQNAKINKVDKKIKFLKGDLLQPFIHNSKFKIQNSHIVILANLPYLSEKIYNSTPKSVKKYEPKSALFSPQGGLGHYAKLLKQLKKIRSKCFMFHVSCFMEISPEQKSKIAKLIKSYFPKAEKNFYKDLSGRWRICRVEL